MNDITYVQLVQLSNNELWFFKEENGQFVPHRQIKSGIIEGEIVNNETGVVS